MSRSPDISLASTMDEHEELAALFARIWQVPEPSQIYPASLLRAVEFAGNYVAVAKLDGRIVGGAVAFFGRGGHLHSDIAGVDASVRGRGIGLALKLHQRSWALERGVRSIQWTFDPTLFRNARLNIHRLGGYAVAYLPDFYGRMDDGINADTGPSDRLLVDWRIDTPRVRGAITEGLAEPTDGLRVPIGPLDRLRADLTKAFDDGMRITDVTVDNHYIMERPG
ncbi:GNAT family N-acetyltransferase [Stackebrandtia nassauensis]|uniref:N-acetyltransferase domain-containing protein n=1 Tax=Stackebrandtia nassauensis (strain DSM 44728 / CIP 108903 / NRRL B-16338 / NBRC 102104 / LLR-40K-21) TaxID=446470 RepID=D3PYQ4_STANL|nr:GNAT family N-acetyltransferase [Stackebrandtia nassauensis]ADD43487.1 conserved hypothetical protein [Stackebrandtia nassauensis DSM 44728]